METIKQLEIRKFEEAREKRDVAGNRGEVGIANFWQEIMNTRERIKKMFDEAHGR